MQDSQHLKPDKIRQAAVIQGRSTNFTEVLCNAWIVPGIILLLHLIIIMVCDEDVMHSFKR